MTDAGPSTTAAAPPTASTTTAATAAATAATTLTAPDGTPASVPSAAAPPVTFYPQYCFHLSPTLSCRCPMSVADVVRLDRYAQFQGQNVFFHLNHPVRWVRIVGVVVACNAFQYRTLYTVDDGSGETVECVVSHLPVPVSAVAVASTSAPAAAATAAVASSGAVVEIRGETQIFDPHHADRSPYIQVRVTKLAVLRGTEQEVRFWATRLAFARDTLHVPWVLDHATVRACRKAALESAEEAGARSGDAKDAQDAVSRRRRRR